MTSGGKRYPAKAEASVGRGRRWQRDLIARVSLMRRRDEQRNSAVVIGFQALAWVVILFLAHVTPHGAAVSRLKDWAALVTFGAIAVSYALGLVLDVWIR